MMKKIKLTLEQATAIEKWLENYGDDKEELLRLHAGNGIWSKYSIAMNELSLSDMAKALFVGYEVGFQVFQVGDWIVNRHGSVGLVEEIINDNYCGNWYTIDGYFICSMCVYKTTSSLRKATSEETKKVKLLPLWKEIVRDAGEFKIGDIIELDNQLGFKIYYDSQIETAKEQYEAGNVTGFYPAESFVSLSGDEDTNKNKTELDNIFA